MCDELRWLSVCWINMAHITLHVSWFWCSLLGFPCEITNSDTVFDDNSLHMLEDKTTLPVFMTIVAPLPVLDKSCDTICWKLMTKVSISWYMIPFAFRKWRRIRAVAPQLISRPSTPDSFQINWHLDRPHQCVLPPQGGNTKWHLHSQGTGEIWNYPYHLSMVFATLAFKIMNSCRQAHWRERHFTSPHRTAAALQQQKYL